VGLGRALREKHKLKTRQPLRRVTIVHHETRARAALETPPPSSSPTSST
jgi:hypothetical protein